MLQPPNISCPGLGAQAAERGDLQMLGLSSRPMPKRRSGDSFAELYSAGSPSVMVLHKPGLIVQRLAE